MFKIAKSKIVKIVEQKLRDGDREGAMKLLREAEAADRTGAFTAKEIKGLHDDPSRVYGNGQYGRVRDRFYGGEMLPAKELRRGANMGGDLTTAQLTGRFGNMEKRLFLHEHEAALNRNVQNIVANDPKLQELGIKTPQYFGSNKARMEGQGLDDLAAELEQLSSRNVKSLSRQERGRLKFLESRIQSAVKRGDDGFVRLGVGQVQPMTRLPEAADMSQMSKMEVGKLQSRLRQGLDRLHKEYGLVDKDKLIDVAIPNSSYAKGLQHNVRVGGGAAGDMYLFDFGQMRNDPSRGQRTPVATPAPQRTPVATPAPQRTPVATPAPQRTPVATPAPQRTPVVNRPRVRELPGRSLPEMPRPTTRPTVGGNRGPMPMPRRDYNTGRIAAAGAGLIGAGLLGRYLYQKRKNQESK
jgi:hypothetical protein